MGLAEGSDSYKIYDPTTKRMNTSRDVFFLKGKVKPQFHLSTIIEGRNKGEMFLVISKISPATYQTKMALPEPTLRSKGTKSLSGGHFTSHQVLDNQIGEKIE